MKLVIIRKLNFDAISCILWEISIGKIIIKIIIWNLSVVYLSKEDLPTELKLVELLLSVNFSFNSFTISHVLKL